MVLVAILARADVFSAALPAIGCVRRVPRTVHAAYIPVLLRFFICAILARERKLAL